MPKCPKCGAPTTEAVTSWHPTGDCTDLRAEHLHDVCACGFAWTRPVAAVILPASCMLSARELEVLRTVALGQTYVQVGHTLGISPQTAKNHMGRAMAKLEVSNGIAAVVYAIRRGWVEV